MERNWLNGNDLMLLLSNDIVLAYVTNTAFSLSATTEEITTKDSGWSPKQISNGYTWQITSDALVPADLSALATLRDALANGTELDIVFTKVSQNTSKGLTREGGDQTEWTSGTSFASGKGIVAQLDINAEAGSNATYTVQINGSGAISEIAVENGTSGGGQTPGQTQS